MAEERRTDRRTLQRMLELAEDEVDIAEVDGNETYSDYYRGVADGLRQALGENIFEVQEIKHFKLSKTTTTTLSTTPVAAGTNQTEETEPNGL